MKQYKFLIDEPQKLELYEAQVATILKEHPRAVPLIQFTEPSGDIEYIQYGVDFAQKAFPGIAILGMTAHCAQTADCLDCNWYFFWLRSNRVLTILRKS